MMKNMSLWLSQKGVDYVLHPKRGAFNLINPDVASTLTAKGQNNWIGTFIAPDVDHVEHEIKLGGATPTVIYMKDGRVIIFDGAEYRSRD